MPISGLFPHREQEQQSDMLISSKQLHRSQFNLRHPAKLKGTSVYPVMGIPFLQALA